MTKSLELIGKIFGHLTVVSRVKTVKKEAQDGYAIVLVVTGILLLVMN